MKVKSYILHFFLAVAFLVSCTNETIVENRLKNASSPYLQEHADNPVDWYEWSDEALQKAKKEDKPLLISIGYAACHWCHVMEKESFMDTTVARIMNENFVCIKVDREERPDIDNIYVHACQLLNNGEAGWPLNAFALPDGKPFYAVTYYPKNNWINLLQQIADSYRNKKSKVIMQANSLTIGMMDNDEAFIKDTQTRNTGGQDMYHAAYTGLYKELDLQNGGLKGQTKFPRPSVWEFLLQYNYLTSDKPALNAVENSLEKMALGGIYDHLGGGFARYTTDSIWLVPHFEKMLYDNAQLMSVYAHAYQVTHNEFFKNIAIETADFIEHNLNSTDGGFYSSLNADTEEGEGAYYVWSQEEIRKALGTNAALFEQYYNITAKGDLHDESVSSTAGKNILHASLSPAAYAAKNNLPVTNLINALQQDKKVLLAVREKRIRPSVDDKILTAWNALAIKGFADVYMALGDETYLNKAIANAVFLEKNMLRPDGHLWRTYRNGKASVDAFLDDYALLAKAWIRLYQVSLDKHWLDLAKKITEYAIAHFYDAASSLFYYTPASGEVLAVRKMEIFDNVIPSSNAVMAEVLYTLATYYEEPAYGQKAKAMLEKVAGKIGEMASYYTQWSYVAGLFSFGNNEIAIVGKDAVEKNRSLQKKYLPMAFFMGGTEENLPLLEKKLVAGKTLIYVCTNKMCKQPVEDVSRALQQIK